MYVPKELLLVIARHRSATPLRYDEATEVIRTSSDDGPKRVASVAERFSSVIHLDSLGLTVAAYSCEDFFNLVWNV